MTRATHTVRGVTYTAIVYSPGAALYVLYCWLGKERDERDYEE